MKKEKDENFSRLVGRRRIWKWWWVSCSRLYSFLHSLIVDVYCSLYFSLTFPPFPTIIIMIIMIVIMTTSPLMMIIITRYMKCRHDFAVHCRNSSANELFFPHPPKKNENKKPNKKSESMNQAISREKQSSSVQRLIENTKIKIKKERKRTKFNQYAVLHAVRWRLFQWCYKTGHFSFICQTDKEKKNKTKVLQNKWFWAGLGPIRQFYTRKKKTHKKTDVQLVIRKRKPKQVIFYLYCCLCTFAPFILISIFLLHVFEFIWKKRKENVL